MVARSGLVHLVFLLTARMEISDTGERERQRGGFIFGGCKLRAANSQLFYPLRHQLVQHLCLLQLSSPPAWESGFWTGEEKKINHFLREFLLLLPAELYGSILCTWDAWDPRWHPSGPPPSAQLAPHTSGGAGSVFTCAPARADKDGSLLHRDHCANTARYPSKTHLSVPGEII